MEFEIWFLILLGNLDIDHFVIETQSKLAEGENIFYEQILKFSQSLLECGFW